jgi:hypothetical protein
MQSKFFLFFKKFFFIKFFFSFLRSLAKRIINQKDGLSKTCCLVAVNADSSSDMFNDELSLKLLNKGDILAEELNIRFIVAQSQFYNQSMLFI